MPVIDQITEQITGASDKFFDVAENANERAHGATKNLVTRIQDTDLPFADRMPEVKLPLVDKLPEPLEAVDAYFGFWSKGIETNRAFSERMMSRFNDTADAVVEAAPKATAKKAPAKKSTAKKTAKKA